MKRKLLLTGFVGFAFLFGCSQVDEWEYKLRKVEFLDVR